MKNNGSCLERYNCRIRSGILAQNGNNIPPFRRRFRSAALLRMSWRPFLHAGRAGVGAGTDARPENDDAPPPGPEHIGGKRHPDRRVWQFASYKVNEMNTNTMIWSDAHACRSALRPIYPLAFIFGVLPTATSTGAGSGGYAVGTGVRADTRPWLSFI